MFSWGPDFRTIITGASIVTIEKVGHIARNLLSEAKRLLSSLCFLEPTEMEQELERVWKRVSDDGKIPEEKEKILARAFRHRHFG